MSRITKEMLHPDVGMKWDKQLLLGIEDVFAFLKTQTWAEDFDLSDFSEGIRYGFFPNGYAYKHHIVDGLIRRIVVVSKMFNTTRLKMEVAYDGTAFSGFQLQKEHRSVQGELERALTELHGKPVRVAGASRTDAGVHARGQVAHFDTSLPLPLNKWATILNKRLPEDLLIKSVEKVHPLFHSRYDVLGKEYRYTIALGPYDPILRNVAWAREGVDVERLRQEIASVKGTHDFTSFSKGEKDSMVRTIFVADVEQNGNQIQIVLKGDGFLRYMVRIIVATAVKIAKGELQGSIAEILEDKTRKRTVWLAPPGGLMLTKVWYHE